MSDAPDNLVLRYLRRLDEKIDRLVDQVSELSMEARGMKTHMVGIMQNEVAHDHGLATINQRLDKIGRRLDLRDRDA